MNEQLDNFILSQPEPIKGCFIALKEVILRIDKKITPAWKYSMPFFYVDKKMFCYLWTDKRTGEPYIGVVDGGHIDHPALEKGNRTRMKILRINPYKDLPVRTIRAILKDSLAFRNKRAAK